MEMNSTRALLEERFEKDMAERSGAKGKRDCTFCGKQGHRVSGGCEERKSYSALVNDKEIDTLVNDLTTQNSPKFTTSHIPDGAVTLEQMPSGANYICLHSYARRKNLEHF